MPAFIFASWSVARSTLQESRLKEVPAPGVSSHVSDHPILEGASCSYVNL